MNLQKEIALTKQAIEELRESKDLTALSLAYADLSYFESMSNNDPKN